MLVLSILSRYISCMPTDFYTQPLKEIAQVVMSEPESKPNAGAIKAALSTMCVVTLEKFSPALGTALGSFPQTGQSKKSLWRNCANAIFGLLQKKTIPAEQPEPTAIDIKKYKQALLSLKDALIDETGIDGFYTGSMLNALVNPNSSDVRASLKKLSADELLAIQKFASVFTKSLKVIGREKRARSEGVIAVA